MLPCLLLGAGLLAGAALAADPVTLTIDATQTGYAIPPNYVGLSVSRASISGSHAYRQLFDPNKNACYPHLTNLFAQIGVKHIRVISGTASAADPDPTGTQDDRFFDFARASGVTGVIYSLHLFNEEGDDNVVAARHIWTTPADRALLESFTFDNEPDWKYHFRSPYPDPVITGYAAPAGRGYKDKWAALHADVQNRLGNPLPPAPFSGPDTGSEYPIQMDSAPNTSINGVPFTLRFVLDERSKIMMATQHYYGGDSKTAPVWTPDSAYYVNDTVLDPKDPDRAAFSCIKQVKPGNGHPSSDPSRWKAVAASSKPGPLQLARVALSAARLTEWNLLYTNALAGASGWPSALPFRLTESSPFNNGGGNHGNQAFATALWGLDYFHWWAMHGCAGIDPFTRVAQYNSPIFCQQDGDFVAEPYAYGIKAFSLGSRGATINATGFQISNPASINVTVYGVVGANDLYVTVINKTFQQAGARDAALTINRPSGFTPESARYIILAGDPEGDITATTATLGGATIPVEGNWTGTWHPLPPTNGAYKLTVHPATAVIVDLQSRP